MSKAPCSYYPEDMPHNIPIYPRDDYIEEYARRRATMQEGLLPEQRFTPPIPKIPNNLISLSRGQVRAAIALGITNELRAWLILREIKPVWQRSEAVDYLVEKLELKKDTIKRWFKKSPYWNIDTNVIELKSAQACPTYMYHFPLSRILGKVKYYRDFLYTLLTLSPFLTLSSQEGIAKSVGKHRSAVSKRLNRAAEGRQFISKRALGALHSTRRRRFEYSKEEALDVSFRIREKSISLGNKPLPMYIRYEKKAKKRSPCGKPYSKALVDRSGASRYTRAFVLADLGKVYDDKEVVAAYPSKRELNRSKRILNKTKGNPPAPSEETLTNLAVIVTKLTVKPNAKSHLSREQALHIHCVLNERRKLSLINEAKGGGHSHSEVFGDFDVTKRLSEITIKETPEDTVVSPFNLNPTPNGSEPLYGWNRRVLHLYTGKYRNHRFLSSKEMEDAREARLIRYYNNRLKPNTKKWNSKLVPQPTMTTDGGKTVVIPMNRLYLNKITGELTTPYLKPDLV